MIAALPTSVTCPWCGLYYDARPQAGHCDNCGGPLPAPTGVDRGPAPPAAPRVLPAAYRRAVMFSRNVLSILGFIFVCVGAPFLAVGGIVSTVASDPSTVAPRAAAHPRHQRSSGLVVALVFVPLGLVFLGAGVPLWLVGRSRGRRQLAALEHGTPADGEVISIELNQSVRVNGRSPWVITYGFNAAAGPVRGTAQSFTFVEGQLQAGARVWVVYLAADPQVSTLWPPVR